MDRGLYIAASGMLAEQIRQDQIANDLATPRRLGAVLEVSKPGGTLDGYLNTLDTIATNLALAVSSPPSGGCSRPRSPSRSCPRPRTLTSQRA
jgi:hypothetical protein